jgi:hypothetical protein
LKCCRQFHSRNTQQNCCKEHKEVFIDQQAQKKQTTQNNADTDSAEKITTGLLLDALISLFELHPASFELTLKVGTRGTELRMQFTSGISPAVLIAVWILVHANGLRKD